MIDERYFTYEGKHCYNECSLAQAGKMCQCQYDRLYERYAFEHPQLDMPKVAIGELSIITFEDNA